MRFKVGRASSVKRDSRVRFLDADPLGAVGEWIVRRLQPVVCRIMTGQRFHFPSYRPEFLPLSTVADENAGSNPADGARGRTGPIPR